MALSDVNSGSGNSWSNSVGITHHSLTLADHFVTLFSKKSELELVEQQCWSSYATFRRFWASLA